MLVCNNCVEKEATWADTKTNLIWCDNCVPKECIDQKQIIISLDKINKNPNLIDELINKYEFGNNFNLFGYKKINKKIIKSNINVEDLFETDFIDKYLKDNKTIIKLVESDSSKSNKIPCPDIKKTSFRQYFTPLSDFLINLNKPNKLIFINELINHSTYYDGYPVNINHSNILEPSFFKNFNKELLEIIKNFNIKTIPEKDIIFVHTEGVHFEKSEIDFYIEPFDLNDISIKILIDYFFNTGSNKIIKYIDENNFFNENINFFFFDLYEYKEQKRISNKIDKYYKDMEIDLIKISDFLIEDIKNRLLKKQNFKYIKGIEKKIFNTLSKLHHINENVKTLDVLNPNIHYGCDCGCGGDLLTEEDYENGEKLIEERKMIFIEFFKLIY